MRYSSCDNKQHIKKINEKSKFSTLNTNVNNKSKTRAFSGNHIKSKTSSTTICNQSFSKEKRVYNSLAKRRDNTKDSSIIKVRKLNNTNISNRTASNKLLYKDNTTTVIKKNINNISKKDNLNKSGFLNISNISKRYNSLNKNISFNKNKSTSKNKSLSKNVNTNITNIKKTRNSSLLNSNKNSINISNLKYSNNRTVDNILKTRFNGVYKPNHIEHKIGAKEHKEKITSYNKDNKINPIKNIYTNETFTPMNNITSGYRTYINSVTNKNNIKKK